MNNIKVRETDNKTIIEAELNNFYEIPDDAKVVVDIGAHIGGTSVYAARKGMEVYAYEPNEDNYKLLVENTKDFKNVHTFNEAVSGDGKDRDFYVKSDSLLHSFYPTSNKDYKVIKKVNIKTTTLTDILNKIGRCDFIKLDCEGAEQEILLNTDVSKIKNISMQIDFGKKEIIDYLSSWFNHRVRAYPDEYIFKNYE